MKAAAVKWLKQAKHDLEMAGKNIDIGGYDVAAFLFSADYMIARYPDVGDTVPFEEYDKDISLEKVATAKRIFKDLKGRYHILEGPDE